MNSKISQSQNNGGKKGQSNLVSPPTPAPPPIIQKINLVKDYL